MGDDHDKALLVAFGDWLYPRIGLEVWHREIDAFLSTRRPPGERDADYPYCAKHSLADCAECHGGSSPEMESEAPARQIEPADPALTAEIRRDAGPPAPQRVFPTGRARLAVGSTPPAPFDESKRRNCMPAPPVCRGCGVPLRHENLRCADGCPCNSPRGVNHGLVPTNVCVCVACDPEETGSVRTLSKQSAPPAPERFWRVIRAPERETLDLDGYEAVQVVAVAGVPGVRCAIERSLSPDLRPTRELAEADGAKSGLEPWISGGVVSTLGAMTKEGT